MDVAMEQDGVNSRAEAKFVAGTPRLIYDEDSHRHRQAQRRLAIAMADERRHGSLARELPLGRHR
jgi:hypothetical protein